MNKHLKCALKVLFVLPVLIIALFSTILQFFFVVIPLGLLSLSGCIDTDLPDVFADKFLTWFHDL